MKPSLRRLMVGSLETLMGVSGRQRLSVLMYHRVLPDSDFMRPEETTLQQFEWQMELISRYLNPLSIKDALALMDAGSLPDRAICVTFDDGYADNLQLALPVLQKWAVPATVFVSTSFLDGGIMWNDVVLETFRSATNEELDFTEYGLGCYRLDSEDSRYRCAIEVIRKIKHLAPSIRKDIVDAISSHAGCIPKDLMLTSEQLLQLHERGIDIGAHTHTHPILASITPEEAFLEVDTSRKILQDLTGDKVRYFAYPNGTPGADYNSEHVSIVRGLGFEAAFSTVRGVSDALTDKFQLARFTPWDKSPDRYLARLLLNQRALLANNAGKAAKPGKG